MVLTGIAACHRPPAWRTDPFFKQFRIDVRDVIANKNKSKMSLRKRVTCKHVTVDMKLASGDGSHTMVVEGTAQYMSIEATVENIAFVASQVRQSQ